jgi:hypothetical protein
MSCRLLRFGLLALMLSAAFASARSPDPPAKSPAAPAPVINPAAPTSPALAVNARGR